MGTRPPARDTHPPDQSGATGAPSATDDPGAPGGRLTAQETVPTAGDFWSAGAAAVHGAIQPSGKRTETSASPTASTQAPPRRPRTRRTRSIPRRPWGFSARTAAAEPLDPRIRLRPRAVAITAGLACLLAAAAIGLAEGGAPSTTHGQRTSASVGATGSSHQRLLGLAASGLPRTGSHTSVANPTVDSQRAASHKKTEARAQAAARARARARRRRLARLKAARARRRHQTSTRRAAATSGRSPATSGTSPTTSGSSPTETTPPPVTQTTPPPTEPTTTSPTVTSAAGAGSTSHSAPTTTHPHAFGATGVLGAGHQG